MIDLDLISFLDHLRIYLANNNKQHTNGYNYYRFVVCGGSNQNHKSPEIDVMGQGTTRRRRSAYIPMG